MGIGEFPTGEKHDGGLKEILVALGLVAAAVGGTAVLKKYELGMDDISATIAYLEAKTFGTSSEITAADSLTPLAPTPAPTVMPANGSATPTPVPAPEKPFLMYDGIKIIGDEQFQKDVVMTYEFAKKYSPGDYNLISKHKWVESSDVIKTAGAGGDGFSWGKKRLREMIENKKVIDAVGTALHEYGHNTVWNTKERTNETYANIFAFEGRKNLSYVNQSEIDKFYQDFDFSKYEKEIQTI